MSLSGALFSGVGGLDALSTAISVVGDNIANVNTTGFKSRRTEFSDVLGQSLATAGGVSQIGAGSSVGRVSTIYSQGTFETTSRPTDLAIDGRGFFVLEGNIGRTYTRAGLFNFDRDGFLVNPQGSRVQGFGIDPLTGVSNGVLGDLQLSNAPLPPNPTANIGISTNLESTSTLIPGGFDPSNPDSTSNFRTTIQVFDSLGAPHNATVYFTKTGIGAGPVHDWAWTATLDPSDTTLPPATAGDPVVIQGSGTLQFDDSGVLTLVDGAPTGQTSVTFEFAGGAAAGQVSTLDFGVVAGVGTGAPTTQVAGPSAVNSFSQDGYASGTLRNILIDDVGFLVGQFSNGEVQALGQVALSIFPNVEGLQTVGNNTLLETRTSGQPIIGEPRTGSLGSIRASALEQSNVDLANEFVRLIVNQRAFQANTRTISTTNELLGSLVNLGQ